VEANISLIKFVRHVTDFKRLRVACVIEIEFVHQSYSKQDALLSFWHDRTRIVAKLSKIILSVLCYGIIVCPMSLCQTW
jgi:hypothetical protein